MKRVSILAAAVFAAGLGCATVSMAATDPVANGSFERLNPGGVDPSNAASLDAAVRGSDSTSSSEVFTRDSMDLARLATASRALPAAGPAPSDDTRVIDTLAISVAEPAAWAMMLIGFGGMGATRRWRRAHLAA